ncbi:hypothetical protein SUGI_0478280 [Cryptomeria japonica]|uniref:uncharacterized protein LOC131043272 n=1 Tax=Cryptomeria japonica TaxID=3369 RepID=UPI002408D0DC|nr:uncharacterized protein LOC131043272 [Cryptomeria japonica]GLJ24981.1 hypothetical protein SUGI_0478280 [Cryptomeria japonica]
MSANNIVSKENLIIGKTFVSGSDLLCAVPTSSADAVSEEPELRAYKLGKQKCSYNQIELLFYDLRGQNPVGMKISEAIETCIGSEVEDILKESCLKFNVRFLTDMRMNLYIFVVHANAHLKLEGSSPSDGTKYYWMPVTRSNCKKGCRGPVLRGLQRFGKMSRRGEGTEQDSWKEPRHLYIAIDEASTHVCIDPAENPKFRFLLAAYNDLYELLGTTISSSIRVLSNNDAPRGTASLKVHFNLQEGWKHDLPQTPRLSSLPDLRSKDIELYPQLIDGDQTGDESAIVVDGLSAKKTQEFSVKQHEPEKNLTEDNHSLNELCERLFEICASKVGSVISLRTLAALVGTRRKRIYEIFNVLQCVLIVEQKEEREKYSWLGATKISSAIKKLKQEAPLSKKPYRRKQLKYPTDEMVENPIRELTERFIQLFLVNEKRSITLDFAVDALLDPRIDPQTHRCKMRRLTEIARILTVLNLISTKRSFSGSGSLFSWRGASGVKQRLVIADSGKKTLKRRSAGLNPKKKAVKNKDPKFNISKIAMQNMPSLVSETDDDDEILPPLEMECNRLIKRPRLCATAANFTTEKNCASILSKGSMPAPSNPKKIDGYYSRGSDSANPSSPLQNLDHNDADAVNYEVAAMLMCLSSSDQLNSINSKSSPQVILNDQIEAETQQKPPTINEIEEKSICPSNATTELCSKYFEDEAVFHQSDQGFDPLFHLQQIFSPSQIAQLQAENPGFMFDFVRYSRQLYQKWCAKKISTNKQKNLFNPVPIRAIYNTDFVDTLASGQDQM